VRLLLVYKSYNAFVSAEIIVPQTVFKMEVPVKDLKDMSRQEIKQTYEAFQFDFDEKRGTDRLRASLALNLKYKLPNEKPKRRLGKLKAFFCENEIEQIPILRDISSYLQSLNKPGHKHFKNAQKCVNSEPVRQDAAQVLRFDNPNNLCYSNAAVTVLMNITRMTEKRNNSSDKGPLLRELCRLCSLPPGIQSSTFTVRRIVSEFCRSVDHTTERNFDSGQQ
jgi:hypothetical protein